MEEVIVDYKLGIIDPSREAAKVEKQNRIKKRVGLKKLQLKVKPI